MLVMKCHPYVRLASCKSRDQVLRAAAIIIRCTHTGTVGRRWEITASYLYPDNDYMPLFRDGEAKCGDTAFCVARLFRSRVLQKVNEMIDPT